ncbi:MAG: hypothetical protein ACLFUX_00880 [Spirochaetaceae bacterium]
MRFKIIFVVFNAIILVSFLFIFLIPFFMLGWDYTQAFWSDNWSVAVIFVVVLAGLNAYFLLNWKLFTLLEREDWYALIDYIEDGVYTRKRFGKQHLRVLINAYLITSQPDKIARLEQFLRENRRSLVPRFALHLGIPHLLGNDAADMKAYYGEMRNDPNCADRDWIDWDYAFALMLNHEQEDAKEVLESLLTRAKNDVLVLLTIYLLDAFTVAESRILNIVMERKRAFQTKYTPEQWNKEVEKNRGNLQVIVLSKLIRDAGNWVFSDGTQAA